MIIDLDFSVYLKKASKHVKLIYACFDQKSDYSNPVLISEIVENYIKTGLVKVTFPQNKTRELFLSPKEKQIKILVDFLQIKAPELIYAPKFCETKAKNIIDTEIMCLMQLATALVEESQLRFFDSSSKNNKKTFFSFVKEVLAQQLMAMDVYTIVAMDTQKMNFNQHVDKEIQRNKKTLEKISKLLKQIVQAKQISVENNSEKIHRSVANIWSIITSNEALVTPDINYRALSMKKPGASRSLFAYSKPAPHFHSSSVANYVTYTEVPLTTNIFGEERGFGFLNCVNVDKDTGQGYIVERPHYMYSSKIMKLAECVKGAKDKIFAFDAKSERNHDLWHHLVQIYADHFQIHHDSAPISNGGYLKSYINFGMELRRYRESYELAAGIGHLEVFAKTDAMNKEINLFREACDAAEDVYKELCKKGKKNTAKKFVSYISTAILGSELLVFPKSSLQFKEFSRRINGLEVQPVSIDLSDVVKVLDGQKLIPISTKQKISLINDLLKVSKNSNIRILPKISNWLSLKEKNKLSKLKYAECVDGAFHEALYFFEKDLLLDLLAKHKRPKRYDGEYGSYYFYKYLERSGVLNKQAVYPRVLKGVDAINWILNTGEIQPALWGYIEKIHNLKKVPFADTAYVNLFEMAIKQQVSLEKDNQVYWNRIVLQQTGQIVIHELLMLFIDDYYKLAKNPVPRWLMKTLKEGNPEEKKIVINSILVLDALVHNIRNQKATRLSKSQRETLDALVKISMSDNTFINKRCTHRINQTIVGYDNFVRKTGNLFIGVRGKTAKPNKTLIVSHNKKSKVKKRLDILAPNVLKKKVLRDSKSQKYYTPYI